MGHTIDIDRNIQHWFADQGQLFDNTPSRTDYYLPAVKEDLTVKLREGNIEIKQRIEARELLKLSKNVVGYTENCIKWSFLLDKETTFPMKIIEAQKDSWIETIKTRMGIKAYTSEKGNTNIVNIKENIKFGIQIEYTKVQVNGNIWYSFGLEHFGEKESELEPELLDRLFGEARLNAEESMGYATFLMKN